MICQFSTHVFNISRTPLNILAIQLLTFTDSEAGARGLPAAGRDGLAEQGAAVQLGRLGRTRPGGRPLRRVGGAREDGEVQPVFPAPDRRTAHATTHEVQLAGDTGDHVKEQPILLLRRSIDPIMRVVT